MKKTRSKRLLALIMALFLVWSTCYLPGTQAAESAEYDGGFGISDILSQFQFFVSDDVTMGGGGHTVGAVVVGGTLDLQNTFGDAAIVPSYIGHLKAGSFGTAWHGKYPDKNSTVYYGTSDNQYMDSNVWIENPDYIDVSAAFAAIEDESTRLASADNSTTVHAADGVVTIDCTGTDDVYVVLDYADLANNNVNIVVNDVDWFKNHICCVSITGADGNEVNFDCSSKIQLNGTGINNALKNMSGSDEEYSSQLNVEGMNLVWNFPDATGTIKAPGLGGHLVAPQATVDLQWNYEGGVIAKNITGSAQGHFYPMSRTLKTQEEGDDPDDTVTATGTFSKRALTGTDELDGATLTLSYSGEFNPAEEAVWVSGPQVTRNRNTKTISWKSSKTAGPLVLSDLPTGYYTLAETAAPNGYKYASSISFKVEDGKIYMGTRDASGKVTYSTTPMGADDVIVMRDDVVTGTFSKKAATGTAELPGATITLTYTGSGSLANVSRKSGPALSTQNGTKIVWVSGNEPLVLEKLPNGTYVMEETGAPAGYTYAEKIYFKVEAGKIYKAKVTANGEPERDEYNNIVYETDQATTIEMRDDVVAGSFSKKAATGGPELPNAQLSLSYTGSGDLTKVEKKSGPNITKTTDKITWTSGTEELVLEKLPDGDYEMTETTAPQGYKIAETIYFQIRDGKIYKGTKGANGRITYETTPTTGIEMLDAAKTGSVTIGGEKKVTGDAPQGTYKFVLKQGSTVLGEANVTGEGTFTFPALTYGLSDIGRTYTYTVSEVIPAAGEVIDGMTYDETIYTVTVKVTDNAAVDNLVTTVTITKGTAKVNSIVFTNEYEEPVTPAEGTGVFSKKAITGGAELPGATLSLKYTGDGSLDAVTRKSGPEFTLTDDTITWDSGSIPLVLEKLPDGEYVMTETGAPKGYKYAEEIYFKIDEGKTYVGTKNAQGDIEYATDPSTKLEMIDTAKAGKATLVGTKTVTGEAPIETYSFTVTEGDAVVATGTVDGSNAITFTEIEYGPKDIGTHTYIVTEDIPSPKTEGMTYDETKFTVTVKVEDLGDDELAVTVIYGEDIAFVNEYEAPKTPDEPTPEEPSSETPSTETPSTETPSTETPSTETPSTETPSTETPDIPVIDEPEEGKGNLVVQVRDEVTKDPVPNAKITITHPDGTVEECTTDELGTVFKKDLPPGDYTITVKEVPDGYTVTLGRQDTVTVVSGQTATHIIEINTSTSDKTAKTGDSFQVVLPVALLIYAAVMMIILGYRKKRA